MDLPEPALPGGRNRYTERGSDVEELRRRADLICRHILQSDYPPINVEIERARLREWCAETFPGRMELYEMIYESRFDRLIEQFGEDRPG